MKWDYPAKKELVAEVLFEEDELKSGDGWRYEVGSYFFRKDPLILITVYYPGRVAMPTDFWATRKLESHVVTVSMKHFK